MRNTIWTATATAIVAATAAAAMAQAPPAQQNSAASGDQKVTVTGCLKAAPTSADARTTTGAVGTTGTTGPAGAADASFVLTDVMSSAKTDPSTAGSTTTNGNQASSARSAQTYRLIANAASLSPHVGKKLELTGTVEDQSAPTTSSTPAASASNVPALRVEAGKVIAASCD